MNHLLALLALALFVEGRRRRANDPRTARAVRGNRRLRDGLFTTTTTIRRATPIALALLLSG